MKPAKFYALQQHWNGLRIIAVTLCKGSRIYGRDADGNPTHCRVRDITGYFPTEQAASDAIGGVKGIRDGFRDKRRAHENALTQLCHDEADAIARFLSAKTPA